MRRGFSSALALFALASAALAADDLDPVKEQAVRLYDQAKYAEALTTLEQLDIARAVDGPLLYRMFFCQRAAGHDDQARKTLERARLALEGEIAKSKSIEVPFYLANAYGNLGLTAEAKKTAEETTKRIEKRKIAAPKTAIGLFQVGKLYQDQAREDKASDYYRKALDAFDLTDGRYIGNARWALRYLGSTASARSDFAAAEMALARLSEIGGAELAEYESLAVARLRLAKYGPAAEAWKAKVKMNPADADDARYAARLAETASAIAPLPAGAPGGAVFTAMSQSELETFLKAQAQSASAAQSGTVDANRRAETAAALLETRRRFVAACLEYAIRAFGIRETAFREGYAVLIFQDSAWELPAEKEAEAGAAETKGS